MRIIPTAVISRDPHFRDALREALRDAAPELDVGIVLSEPVGGIGTPEVERMKEAKTELVFLDLEGDLPGALRLAHSLEESRAGHRFIAVGPELSQSGLMEAMRAGITEFLPKPLDRTELGAALDRTRRKLVSPSGNGHAPTIGRFFAVMGSKGGVGATTVATNLAVAIHKASGKRTLLVDMALMGDASSFLGMMPRFDFVDMVRNLHRMDAGLLTSYIEPHESGIHLLSAPFQPDKAEGLPADGIRKLLSFLKQHYEYGVIEVSRTLSPGALAALDQAEDIFLVAEADLSSLRNIKRSLALLEKVSGAEGEKIRLVINRYKASGLISRAEIEKALELPVCRTLSNSYEAACRSLDAGKPAVGNTRCALARDLDALGKDLAGAKDETNGRRGFLGSLKGLFSRRDRPGRKATPAHG